MKKFQDIFGFLFNIQTYKDIHSDYLRSAELLKMCRSLQLALSEKGDGTVDDESDIDGQSLFDELKMIANILPQNTVSPPLEVQRYVVSSGLHEMLPQFRVTNSGPSLLDPPLNTINRATNCLMPALLGTAYSKTL